MLNLCVDAVKATGVISSARLQTLDSILHTLRSLLNLTAAIAQVLHGDTIGASELDLHL